MQKVGEIFVGELGSFMQVLGHEIFPSFLFADVIGSVAAFAAVVVGAFDVAAARVEQADGIFGFIEQVS
jgi:hypothetical protein